MMARLLRALLLLAIALLPRAVSAHEVRPAYLELRPAGPAEWAVLWRVPALGGAWRLRLDAQLPGGCVPLGARQGTFAGDAYVERWTARCPDGLAGGVIRFDGLAALRNDVLLRIERADGRDAISARLTPSTPRFVVPAEPALRDVMVTYVGLGVEHILLGADHLLFVLGLMLIVRGWRRLALTITAFTAGHTLTLAAATLGAISLPGPPVEAAIALSIVFAAAEALRIRAGERTLMATAPWTVALLFGLLHGLGFAGALRAIGLPETAMLPALLFFNLGVEIGQLAFVLAVLAAGWALRHGSGRLVGGDAATRLAGSATRATAYGIGAVAAFWLIDRMVAFWA